MNDDVLTVFHSMALPDGHQAAENPVVRAQVENQIRLFPTWVLPSIECPEVICGLIHANGIGELWMIPRKGFKRGAPVVFRMIKTMIETLQPAFGLHRLHMLIDPRDGKARLWAERLGFIQEALLTRIGHDGRDRFMYLYPETRVR